jgi:DNA polymerase III subunit delta
MIHLFHGPNEFARSEAVATIRQRVPADLAELNITVLEGRRLKVDALAAACEALPFLSDQRIVVVYDALKQLKAGKERDEIIAYLDKVPTSCELIFVERDDVDKRGALFNRLGKIAQVREFLPLEGNELLRWLNERANQLAAKIEPAAAQKLIEYTGNDGRALTNELGKLATYVGRDGRITPQTVDLLSQDQQEQNLFSFIDDLSARKRAAALRGLRLLLEEGQAATYIMFMLARQVRILLGVQELASRRMRPEQIAAELGQKPFVVRKAMDQARHYGPGELATIHDRLLEFDHASKTGRIAAETALEILVLEVCAK